MPYRESFAWAVVPLFDNNITTNAAESASPSSPLAPSMTASSSHEGVFEPIAKITSDGKQGYSSGSSVVVEISNLNKVKESYSEESIQVGCLTFTANTVFSHGFMMFFMIVYTFL